MTGTTTAFNTINTYVQFGTNLTLLVFAMGGGILFIYSFTKGGFRFWHIGKRVGKFMDSIEMVIDDFFPEVLSGLEKNNLITSGVLARWTSARASTLKATSPIRITDQGTAIIVEIRFEQTYDENLAVIDSAVQEKLSARRDDGNTPTEYDIEQTSLIVSRELFDQNNVVMREAKNYLYQHPAFPASEMITLLGIYIRDRVSQATAQHRQSVHDPI